MGRIDINSSEYPQRLNDLEDPPPFLYYRGEWNPGLFDKTISVAGTRNETSYGALMTEELLAPMAASGITVVAGLMEGIDLLSHEAALGAGGCSIAVPAGGIERSLSEELKKMEKRIISAGGLLLSPYSDETFPSLGSFYRRNRIITALSPLLLVLEAGEKSGALKTAQAALNCNRKIYAVPGPLSSSRSRGTALLIKKGASIVTGPEDLLGEYGICTFTSSETQQRLYPDLSDRQREIISLLSLEPLSIDDLTRKTGYPVHEMGAELTRLCMKKMIALSKGKYMKGDVYAL